MAEGDPGTGSHAAISRHQTPGGRLGSNYARMYVSKSEGHGSFFSLK